MNKFHLSGRKLILIFIYSAVIVWAGWFLWQGSGQNKDKAGATQTEKQYETSDGVNEVNNDPPPMFGVVTDVVDALTIVVDDSYKVRYLGVTVPTTIDKVECMGKEALQANESMLGKTVKLEEDGLLQQTSDGTWIRYVWVADDELTIEAYDKARNDETVLGLTEPIIDVSPSVDPDEKDSANIVPDEVAALPTDGGLTTEGAVTGQVGDVSNDEQKEDQQVMNQEGPKAGIAPELGASEEGEMAVGESDGPKFKEYIVSERIIEMGLGFPLLAKELKHYERLASAARYSSATKRGLWGRCEVSQGENGLLKVQAVEECNIKGVTVMSGEKVYRTPACEGYKYTVVLGYKEGKWLCSEEEAVGSGYVKAIDCK